MKDRLQIPKWLCNEEGATSVLIIFMMIVLVTLGAFAITSANVNIKFSNKAVDWHEKYYVLDSAGEQYAMMLDYALAAAEVASVEYIHDQGYTAPDYEGISDSVQAELAALWKDGGNTTALNVIFARLYMEKAYAEISAMSEKFPNSEIRTTRAGDVITNLEVEVNLGVDENTDYQLCIRLEVQPPAYTFSIQNAGIRARKNFDGARFVVADWYQWQLPKEYVNLQDVWDGSILP